MSKAGLLHSPRRNVHEVTEAGRRLLATKPDRIDNAVLAGFETFASWKAASAAGRREGEEDPSGPIPPKSRSAGPSRN